MFYTFITTLFLGFEIQKIFQFNFFFRLKCITSDYSKRITLKINSIVYKEILKISLVDLMYIIVLLIGLFTINKYFLCGILVLGALDTIIFKFIKNKTFRKIFFIIDILLSIIFLSLSIINSLYFQLDGIQFIKQIINYGKFISL